MFAPFYKYNVTILYSYSVASYSQLAAQMSGGVAPMYVRVLSPTCRVFNERERGELEESPDQFTHRHNLYVLNGLIPAISEYLRTEHPQYYRVGAVYLLYAVYMNQPPSVDPIRVRSDALPSGRVVYPTWWAGSPPRQYVLKSSNFRLHAAVNSPLMCNVCIAKYRELHLIVCTSCHGAP